MNLVNSLFLTYYRSRHHPLLLATPRWRSRSAGPLRSGQVLVPAVPYCRTSVPEAKKEKTRDLVVLSWPSSAATTTVVVANGDPSFRRVRWLALRPFVVCHSCGADRFTTSAPLSDIAGLDLSFRI